MNKKFLLSAAICAAGWVQSAAAISNLELIAVGSLGGTNDLVIGIVKSNGRLSSFFSCLQLTLAPYT